MTRLTSAERRALKLLYAQYRRGDKPTPFAVLVKRVGRNRRPKRKGGGRR